KCDADGASDREWETGADRGVTGWRRDANAIHVVRPESRHQRDSDESAGQRKHCVRRLDAWFQFLDDFVLPRATRSEQLWQFLYGGVERSVSDWLHQSIADRKRRLRNG